MTIAVWADVGGTFTDCFVVDGTSRREIKVLSSGMVRATANPVAGGSPVASSSSITGGADVRWVAAVGAEIDRFWVGARGWLLTEEGSRIPLGQVLSHRSIEARSPIGAQCECELQFAGQPLESAFPSKASTIIELDAGIEAPVLATRLLLGVPLSEPLPPLTVRLGTTRGTNALLTRQGAPTALLVTEGFGDILRIGQQDRPDLFALAIKKLPPLTQTVIEVRERMDASGRVLDPIDLKRLRHDLSAAIQSGIESLAICLLHSHINDQHERLARTLAEELGVKEISCSSEVAPLIKLGSRAETTTLDAYLNPILSGYVSTIWKQFGGESKCKLRLMTSSGNLVAPSAFRGRDSILSGPAGGVVALGHVASVAKVDSVIGLDMGGTSTDVSRFQGRVGRRYESQVAGIRVLTPMMDIETVAAGGGSICGLTEDGRLTVGPASAGADPGPACYGRGGPLTVTDVNLLLGRIPASRFPFPLRREAAEQRLREIRQRMNPATTEPSESLAEGFLNIAVTHMAEAVRRVSTSQGTDVRNLALVGFGGAAGQHLCRIANTLGVRRILDHPDAGMLSALGMGLAPIGRVVSRGIYQPLHDCSAESIDEVARQLATEATELLRHEHEDSGNLRKMFECDLRYQGTDAALTLDWEPKSTLADRFHRAHHDTFGYAQTDRPIQLVVIRCEAIVQAATPSEVVDELRSDPSERDSSERDPSERDSSERDPSERDPSQQQTAAELTRIWHESQWIQAALIDRHTLGIGQVVAAPAMIVGPHSTLVVEPGWTARVMQEGMISLSPSHCETDPQKPAVALSQTLEYSTHDPVLLEVITRRLQGIADAMGEVLRRTSISVNIKERRDYSCAVFRGDGSLIANAPHVPVHLGAMGHTVRHLLSVFPEMHDGDCYLSNDPFRGGSHLPDVTAVTPVFCGEASWGRPDFFVASRAHHAEIGGITPGSMPPQATNLAEEGVLIRDFALSRHGVSHREALRELLVSSPYPSRCPEENLADVAAQQAAGRHGARGLQELARVYSTALVDTMMGRLLELSGNAMQRWIRMLPTSVMAFQDRLDDGTQIGVEIHRQGDSLEIAFTTGRVHPNGFNATPAIVTAAVMYVLRCVCGTELPLCDGVLRNVHLTIPRGLLDPPRHEDPSKCAAVVAGNVETSQRVVDVLLGALQVAAASQGTMNNLLIGDSTFGYYETIGGGSGATAQHDGADAVHTHMTNTRITDPEVLESRIPVRLHRFCIRRGSGGLGIHRGGDGMIREFEFLRPLVVSLITSRRTEPPYGMSGGQPGLCGENRLIRQGQETNLPSTVTLHVQPGDRLILRTPGGGGWGTPPSS